MTPPPLHLALKSIVPTRTPDVGSEVVVHGFHVRLSNGPVLSPADPLLTAYGATMVDLEDVREEGEMFQDRTLDPGRELRLAVEPVEDDSNVVGVWDVERLHRAGALPGDTSSMAIAAIEHGLTYRVMSLREHRILPDNRRNGLSVLLFVDGFVRLSKAGASRYRPPERRQRHRVVLLADGASDLRWWDSGADRGPAEIADLPLSPQLRADLTSLHSAMCTLRKTEARSCNGYFAQYEFEMESLLLDERSEALWRRARAELVQEYVVGFLGRGMTRPIWTPVDLHRHRDDDDCS